LSRMSVSAKCLLLLIFGACFLPLTALAQIKTIYVIPSSHWDRGFITSPNEILPFVKAHIDEVIDDAHDDPKFRWTIESIWQLEAWFDRNPEPARVKELADLVRRGQIEISACYGSMHTSFMGAEELNLLTQDSFRITKALGVGFTDLAMMDDVPGFSQRLPQVLAASHVRYFLNGSNLFIGGGTSLAPGHVPFYWEGPDGSRVLTWVSQGKLGGYTEGLADYYLAPAARDFYQHALFIPKELQGKPLLEIMEIGVKKLLGKYQKAGYPYDAVLVMFLHDFLPPSVEERDLLPMVERWNASGHEPRIRLAIPREFFQHILSKYGSEIPTYRGDWSGLWAQVKTNSPVLSAMARKLQMELRTTSLLWGNLWFRSASAFPSGNLLWDYRQLWNYDEHSGAGQVGWPGLMTVQEINQTNQQYVDYVRSALKDLKFLAQTATQIQDSSNSAGVTAESGSSSMNSEAPTLKVFQPLSWKTESVVHIPAAPDLKGVHCLRGAGSSEILPVQWSSTGGVFVTSLTPTGFSAFRSVACPGKVAGLENEAGSRMLQNRFYRLELRPADGSIRHLMDLEAGREMVNPAAPDAFNQLVRVQGFDRMKTPQSQISFHTTRGPVYDALTVVRSGSVEPMTEYRLYHAVKRLEIRNELDHSWMRIDADSGKAQDYDFAFPVMPNAVIRSVQYEDGDGLVSLPQDYLPGARTDAAVSHGLIITADRLRVALASAQAFFWNFPRKGSGPWNLWNNEVLSTAWRNADWGETRDVGNYIFPTVEPGLPQKQWFIYSVTTWQGDADNGLAYRKIWNSLSSPLVFISRDAGASRPARLNFSVLKLDNPNVMILAAASSHTHPGALILRLQEISGRPQRVDLELPSAGIMATEVDLTETPINPDPLTGTGKIISLEIGANATVSILLTKQKAD
jgi:hypothetical protein